MKKKETIAAVLGEDIVMLLTSINMYDSLLEGNLLCSRCKRRIDENNLLVIIPKAENKFEFICNNPICFESFTEQVEEK